MKSLAVIALLFATSYSAPTIRERLGQVKENNLAQVEAVPACGKVSGKVCGCDCDDIPYPVFNSTELPGAGNSNLTGGVLSAGYNSGV